MVSFARYVKSSLARLRVVSNFLNRIKIMLACPDVLFINRGQVIEKSVRLRASDGGRIVLGVDSKLARGTEIVAQRGSVQIGARSYVGPWSTVVAKVGVKIGSDCLLAERISIRDQDHEIHGNGHRLIANAAFETAAISIGDGVWIGAGAVILKGVNIGKGAVVAANSVVNRDVTENEIVGGVPARQIGTRKI